MKKKVSSIPLIILSILFWTVAVVIQNGLNEGARDQPVDSKRKEAMDTVFADQIDRSLAKFEEFEASTRPYVLPANALATSLSSRTRIKESQIKNAPKDSPKLKEDKGFFFIDSNKQKFAASKLGLDLKHHFQNCFLVGYRPFEVSEIWMPQEVLTMRLKYQLDKDNFAGFEEIWLTSYEAFQRGRGDCEDHAIALADWLIEMGEDARVVSGTHNGGGHAWVVIIRETGTFLLEATDKKRRRLFSSYPLATLAPGYAPSTMFNREYYWINIAPEKTTNYTGSHWIKNGRVTY